MSFTEIVCIAFHYGQKFHSFSNCCKSVSVLWSYVKIFTKLLSCIFLIVVQLKVQKSNSRPGFCASCIHNISLYIWVGLHI